LSREEKFFRFVYVGVGFFSVDVETNSEFDCLSSQGGTSSFRQSANETTSPLIVGARSDEFNESFSVFDIVRGRSIENEFIRFGIICGVSVVNEPL
jgi:hypothetical protein